MRSLLPDVAIIDIRLPPMLKDRISDVPDFLEAVRRVAAGGSAIDSPETRPEHRDERAGEKLIARACRERSAGFYLWVTVKPEEDLMNHITDIRTVAIPVADQDRALAFYVEKLGFDKHMDAPLPQLGGRWIVVCPPGASTTIALVPASDSAPAGSDTGIRFVTSDAAAAHQELTARGVDADDLLTWPGVPPMFTFRDPDGNQLFVVEE